MATGIPKTAMIRRQQRRGNLGSPVPDAILTYSGKRDEREILATPPALARMLWCGTPRQIPRIENRLYYGDNLPILANLLADNSVRGHVRLVYIDPPFATRSAFETRSQSHAYDDLLAGAHYVEFLRQRLVLLRELLSEDGSIYVHLDQKMAFPIKIIMDEVFGNTSFRNWITRKKCNPKNYTRKAYGNVSDFILFYTKSDRYVWNRAFRKWTPERAAKEYSYAEEGTGRRYKKVPLHAPGVRHGETGKPWRGIAPPPGKHWQYPPQILDEMDSRGEIYWSPTGNPRRKIYLDESPGVPIQDLWLEFRDAHNQNIKITGYPTEKNPDLLTRIIAASSNVGDLVLDCFCGSGTTLSVAAELGRQWIGIDNSAEAIGTVLRRFANGLEPMGDFVGKRRPRSKKGLDTPSLFATPLPNERAPSAPPPWAKIQDFCLYGSEPYADELEYHLTQWRASFRATAPLRT